MSKNTKRFFKLISHSLIIFLLKTNVQQLSGHIHIIILGHGLVNLSLPVPCHSTHGGSGLISYLEKRHHLLVC
ncbi:hypothetical protein BDE02_14G029500 [Populus trichocarpa]|nr:hypothetical protein BDE02_14G029500 [Populus trichocarpa]